MNIFVLHEFACELHILCYLSCLSCFSFKIVFIQNDHFEIRCYYQFFYLLFASAKFIERQKCDSGIKLDNLYNRAFTCWIIFSEILPHMHIWERNVCILLQVYVRASRILFAWFLMLTYLTFIVFPNNYHLSSNHATPHDLKIEFSRTMSVSVSPSLCRPRMYECIEIIISLDDDTQTLILETMNCEMELQKKKNER